MSAQNRSSRPSRVDPVSAKRLFAFLSYVLSFRSVSKSTAFRISKGNWSAKASSLLCIAVLIFAHEARSPSSADKDPRGPSRLSQDLWHDAYIKVFRGHFVPEKLSKITVRKPIVSWRKTEEKIGAITTGTKIVDLLGGAMTIEWEGLYADHWGTAEFDEMATAVYARWNRFPWNRYIRTTLAVGMGPSITTKAAPYEPKGGLKSRWLMQLNFELNVYSPSNPDWALLFRIQHRSGVYKLINDVRGGSNFLTIGMRKNF